MKLSKNLGRVATTFLATAMLASVSAVPAFAENYNPGVNGPASGATAVTSVPVTKYVETDGNTFAPATTFKFKVTTAEAMDSFDDGANKPQPVLQGIEGGLGTAETETVDETEVTNYYVTIESKPDYNGDDTVNASDLAVKYTFTGNLQVNADKFANATPGIYHYEIEEVEGSYEGIDYNSKNNKYDIFVYVMDGGEDDNYVGYVVTTKNGQESGATTNNGKSVLEFTNDYGADEEHNDSTHDVLIKKVIEGNQADQSSQFKFDVSVNGADNEYYKVTVDTNGDGTIDNTYFIKSKDTTKLEVALSHTGVVRIYGLTETDTYTVKEKNTTATTVGNVTTVVTTDGYTVTDDVANNAEEGTITGVAKTDVTETTTGDGESAVTTAVPTATITNTRNSVTPTGIVMNVAPYVLLVVVAAAGCFVFLRKRRED